MYKCSCNSFRKNCQSITNRKQAHGKHENSPTSLFLQDWRFWEMEILIILIIYIFVSTLNKRWIGNSTSSKLINLCIVKWDSFHLLTSFNDSRYGPFKTDIVWLIHFHILLLLYVTKLMRAIKIVKTWTVLYQSFLSCTYYKLKHQVTGFFFM